MTFNGNLSTNSNDWIAFASLVGSIGTMLFTGLNVWVFYTLTSTIAKRKENYQKYERQKELASRFNRNINSVFSLDIDGNPCCDINSARLTKLLDWLQKIQGEQTLLPTLGSEDYKTFIEDFKGFCQACQYSESPDCEDPKIACDGYPPENEAYKIYLKANDLISKMFDDMADILP